MSSIILLNTLGATSKCIGAICVCVHWNYLLTHHRPITSKPITRSANTSFARIVCEKPIQIVDFVVNHRDSLKWKRICHWSTASYSSQRKTLSNGCAVQSIFRRHISGTTSNGWWQLSIDTNSAKMNFVKDVKSWRPFFAIAPKMWKNWRSSSRERLRQGKSRHLVIFWKHVLMAIPMRT